MTAEDTGGPDPAAPRIVTDATLALELPFAEADLVRLRRVIAAHASASGLPDRQVDRLVFVAYELATNAIRHGGGRGRLRLWRAAGALHCQVTDDGPGLPPGLASPQPPPIAAASGRGLWLVKTFTDELTFARQPDGGATVTATMNVPSTSDVSGSE